MWRAAPACRDFHPPARGQRLHRRARDQAPARATQPAFGREARSTQAGPPVWRSKVIHPRTVPYLDLQIKAGNPETRAGTRRLFPNDSTATLATPGETAGSSRRAGGGGRARRRRRARAARARARAGGGGGAAEAGGAEAAARRPNTRTPGPPRAQKALTAIRRTSSRSAAGRHARGVLTARVRTRCRPAWAWAFVRVLCWQIHHGLLLPRLHPSKPRL